MTGDDPIPHVRTLGVMAFTLSTDKSSIAMDVEHEERICKWIFGFLTEELARDDTRRLVGLRLIYQRQDLSYLPCKAFDDEEVHSWKFADELELHQKAGQVIQQIIKSAKAVVATAEPSKEHRFMVGTCHETDERWLIVGSSVE